MHPTQTVRISRDEIVGMARGCIGTPYEHQGRVSNGTLDCAGTVVHIYNMNAPKLGLPPYTKTNYGRMPNPKRMVEELRAHLIPIAVGEAREADVLHFAWKLNYPAQHLAILTPTGIVHAHEGVGRVVEHPFTSEWRGRVRGAYRFPGVED